MTRSCARAALPALLLATGCFAPSVSHPRYFEPALPPVAATQAGAARVPLRLRQVAAADCLRDRIMWRLSRSEVGFYDLRRWSAPPAEFVTRGLSERLYEGQGLTRATGASSYTLEVTLDGFEEELAPAHLARVSLRALLLDGEGRARFERSYRRELPIPGEEAEAAAQRVGEALGEALDALARDVTEALPAR